MIKLENIHSLTDFKRNAKEFIEQLRATRTPLVLTVNGKAEVVVQNAEAFQAMLDRLQQAEEELAVLKQEALRQEISLGVEQIENGDYSEYDDQSLPSFLKTIQAKGQHRLTQREL
jgi:prevent-host-death family protein